MANINRSAKPTKEELAAARRELRAKQTLRIYWQVARSYPRELWLTVLYPIGTVLLGVAVPYYTSRILAGIAQPHAPMGGYLRDLAIASLAGLVLYRIGFSCIWRLQANVMSELQRRSLNVLLRRSVGFHSNNISGKLVSDALDFQQAFAQFSNGIIISAMPLSFTLLIGLAVVSVHSWLMGAGLGAIIIIILGWAFIDSRKRARLRSLRLIAQKNLTGHFSDTIINAATVKAFAGESKEAATHLKLNHILRDLRIRDWLRANRSSGNRMTALLGFQVGFLAMVVALVRRDPALLTVGIFAFTYTFMLLQRLFDINSLMRQIEESLLLASPMTRTYFEDVEITDKPGAPALDVTKGGIELKNISFTYAENSGASKVFEGLNLRIRPGEKLGLVGPSGGGKSTFTRLLLRFEDINTGQILIDGQDITAVQQVSLRENIAYVAQEPLLFHRSVRENIAYGRNGATDEEIREAARKACADDFIMKLANGYDTIVGERGVKLSGGQRQRVAIARAILKDAPILILDEATSALDSESEVLVQRALWKLMENRTAIVIAHRLSTIQKMDRIIVLDDGRITEEGTHEQLVKKGGLYATLWNHQSGGFVRDDDEDEEERG